MSQASGAPTLGVGVVGLGFMGRTHIEAYRGAAEAGHAVRLVAVCDPHERRRRGELSRVGNLDSSPPSGESLSFDPEEVESYESLDALLADRDVNAISLCTPTDTHVSLATRALAAGKAVLLEKPVALRGDDIERLIEAEKGATGFCMPAMCMRYWPGWRWLRDRIHDEDFGPVLSARFERLGAAPAWSAFYADAERSGGALFDLHVHDADFVHWCFGPPAAVTSVGTRDHLTTIYRGRGSTPDVVAEGGWLPDRAYPFRMRYRVVFRDAVAEFDLAGTPPLRIFHDGASTPVETRPETGYDGEIRHFVALARETLGSGAAAAGPPPTLEEALAVTRTLEAERASLATGTEIEIARA